MACGNIVFWTEDLKQWRVVILSSGVLLMFPSIYSMLLFKGRDWEKEGVPQGEREREKWKECFLAESMLDL